VSAVTVHLAALSDAHLLARCDVQRSRGGGPGGRHRNSTESRVVVRHVATGVEASAGERRSQHENLDVAVRRLRLALAVEERMRRDAASVPSELWRSRNRGGKVSCSAAHRDFPSLLAEALDVLSGEGWEMRAAATRLGVTATQLVRFVALHGPALASVNRQRGERGMPPLKG
jgi:RF-1 domain